MSIFSDLNEVETLVQSKKILIFDFDGVLVDSLDLKTEAFALLYQQYGDEVVAKVVKHHINNGGMSRYQKFKYYHKIFLNKNIDEKKVNSLSQKFSSIVLEKVISAKEINGASDFLKLFCTKDKLCIVNSATPLNEIKEIVKARGLSTFFQAVYGSPNSKEENLLQIQNTFNIDLKTAVFIGDALSDFNAAKVMKMDFIGIGKKIADDLRNENGNWPILEDFSGFRKSS